jgi:hypothetical protein
MKFEFKFDTAEFINRFKVGNLTKEQDALTQLGSMIVSDAVTKPFTPRIDTGNLRGSWSIAVASKLRAVNVAGVPKKISKGQLSPDINGMGNLELRVAFNMPYSAVMEEGKRKWKGKTQIMGLGVKSLAATPRTGNHFLETKIKNKQKVYLKFLQERLTT